LIPSWSRRSGVSRVSMIGSYLVSDNRIVIENLVRRVAV
jgi:hypothetical protein